MCLLSQEEKHLEKYCQQREVSIEDGRALAQELDCDFFETSVKTGENINSVITSLVQRLRISKQVETEAHAE